MLISVSRTWTGMSVPIRQRKSVAPKMAVL